MGLIYLELALVPLAARSEPRMPIAFKSTGLYGRDAAYLKNGAGWSTAATPGTGANLPMTKAPIPFKAPVWMAAARPLAGNATGNKYTNPLTATAPLAIASPDGVAGTGPGQPEMDAFTSVGSANMVDLFSGDFSYNIPLLDVGGYPVNLAYRAGVTMDQDASWVGLGWNVNPGTIGRSMRGLPDDFNGRYDTVRKIMSIKENKTVGVTAGADIEIAGKSNGGEKASDTTKGAKGASFSFSFGGSLGIMHNNYKGWGLENSINASINAGVPGLGSLTGGLSVANSTMDGLSVTPSASLSTKLL
ncbi:hypothetical protein [Paraflavitalea speifideaquila]|uniref:hypothetical protein n=1 Tax=Paraflavitalea speifideaquila TaxID=3076558 RepID=UPI0028F0FC90|nr:hypothetical protein [Paraflavitalea speifideiaquila]